MTGSSAAAAEVDDSRSESGDTRRSDPKNEPSSPPGILSLLPADLPLRRGPGSAVLGSDDRSDSSSESAVNRRVVSPSEQRPRDQHPPYNISYYGGPHGIVPTSPLIHQHRHHHHHHHQLIQRQHHLQSGHHLHPDNLSNYPPTTDDEPTVVEAELYGSSERDQYYSQSSPLMQYYTQTAASVAIKRLEDMDRI